MTGDDLPFEGGDGFQQLYRDMSLGIAEMAGDFLNMPLARTYDLYELWCFLRLLRVAARHNRGLPVDLSSLFLAGSSCLTIAAGAVSVPVPGATRSRSTFTMMLG